SGISTFTLATSSQTPYPSLPHKCESSLNPLLLLPPQSSFALRGPLTHLLYQYFQIHPSAFDILHRCDLEGMPVAENAHIGCGRDARYHAELKKVGGGGKGRHVGPFLTAMPAFPVSAYLCHGHIRLRLKSLIIL